MKILTIAILLIGGLRSSGGEILDYYDHHINDQPRTLEQMRSGRSYDEITSTNHGITEIGIERTGCFGSCPAYTLIVKNDGSFHYSGGKYAQHVGEFTGTIPIWQFHALAQFIRDSDYMNLQSSYRTSVTDLPTTFTMVVMNGKTKVISNYGGSGPTKLWAIERLIDDLMAKAKWTEVAKPKNSKK